MTDPKPGKPLVDIQGLTKHFPMGKETLVAVKDFTLQIQTGETVGLVGESGCGKSTVGRTLLRLYEPTAGKVYFQGVNLFELSPNELKRMRQQVQIIFQDPYASLNPRLTVEEIIGEGIAIHQLASRADRHARVQELLELVGLRADHANRYPHEFSGGQRQRIGIARALAVNPSFIVCDEPLSALDVSIQAQVVNLLQELQEKLNLTYLFIAHDLSMVEYFARRVAVMYLGRLVELGSNQNLYRNPLHPYTQALLSAIPSPDPIAERKHARPVLRGEVPSPVNPPSGCVFRTRCPHAMPICAQKAPEWQEARPNHFVACHLYSISMQNSSSNC